MNLANIIHLIETNRLTRYSRDKFSEDGDLLVVNNQIAYPVHPVQFSSQPGKEIVIEISGGSSIGKLISTSGLPHTPPSEYTDDQYIAYLTEVSDDNFGTDYKFQYDYAIIYTDFQAAYATSYMATSGLWGGFIHVNTSASVASRSHAVDSIIRAIDNLTIPTDLHAECLSRACQLPFTYERYLKLYHMLELMFDSAIVDKIKQLNSDLNGVGQLLSQFNDRKEIARLKWLLNERISDMTKVIEKLDKCNLYKDPIKRILYHTKKEDNPFSNFEEFEKLIQNNNFSYNSIKTVRNQITRQSHRTIVLDFISFVIYRVRCCIAHSRIGEYVMRPNDEDFVIDFAEPLLRAVLIEVFRK